MDQPAPTTPINKAPLGVTSATSSKKTPATGSMAPPPTPATKSVGKRKATSPPNTGSPASKGKGKATAGPSRKKTKPNRSQHIPQSYEECSEADRTLIAMREAKEPWPKVIAEWERITGEKDVGRSSLPNRYNRLITNFIRMSDEESAALIEVKQAVEDEFHASLWKKVSERMVAKGWESRPAEMLFNQYRKLMLNGDNLDAARTHAAMRSKLQEKVGAGIASGDEEEEFE